VLFDLDGTLIDTRPGVAAAIAAAFAEVTGRDPAVARADLSLPLDDMIRGLAPEASPSQRKLLSDVFRRHYDATDWEMADLYPGAEASLRALRAAGVRAFVVTNKRTSAAARLLERFGLARYLEAIVGQPDTGDPLRKSQLIERCLASAGLDPSSAVVVGDSDQDAAAAQSSGIAFVAVTSGAGPLGHAMSGENRVEVLSLADASALVLRQVRGEEREP
jgi:phosphoglycolate phosphatase